GTTHSICRVHTRNTCSQRSFYVIESLLQFTSCRALACLFFLIIRRPPISTLFPYTTLSDLFSESFNGCLAIFVAGTGKAWPEWLDGDERDSHCEAIGLCEESPQLFFWPQRASVRGGGSKRAGTLEWPCRRLRWNPPRSRTRKGRRSRPRQVGLME